MERRVLEVSDYGEKKFAFFCPLIVPIAFFIIDIASQITVLDIPLDSENLCPQIALWLDAFISYFVPSLITAVAVILVQHGGYKQNVGLRPERWYSLCRLTVLFIFGYLLYFFFRKSVIIQVFVILAGLVFFGRVYCDLEDGMKIHIVAASKRQRKHNSPSADHNI